MSFSKILMGSSLLALVLTACGDKDSDDSGGPPGPNDGGASDGGTGDGGTSGDGGGGDGGGGDGGGGDGGGGDGGGDPDPRDGAYSGSFTMRVFNAGGDLVDTCIGTTLVRIEVGAPRAVQGASHCHFEGSLATSFPDEYSGVVEGTVINETDAAGTLDVTMGTAAVGTEWTGTFGKDDLAALFEGAVTLGGTAYDYNGGFVVRMEEGKPE